MNYLIATLISLVGIALFLWGFDLCHRLTRWRVDELRSALLESKAGAATERREAREEANISALMKKQIESAEVLVTRIENLDISVGKLVAMQIQQRLRVKERQVGEEGSEDPFSLPDPRAKVAAMYKPDGFVEVDGAQVPPNVSTANARALGKPT